MKNIKKAGKRLKRLAIPVILSVLISACATFYACGGVSVKLFAFKREMGGIFRKQSNELIKFDDLKIDEYLAIHNEDWRTVRSYCKLPPALVAAVEGSEGEKQNGQKIISGALSKQISER